MKRKALWLLVFVMAFILIAPAFILARVGISMEVMSCTEIGMLQGSGDGVTVEYVKTNPTRLQAVILYLRLKGLEDKALEYSGEVNFKDVEDYAWDGGRAIMGYLKANPELGWIGDGVNFNPDRKITAAEYYKVILETLGYRQSKYDEVGDFIWDNILGFAAEKGLEKVKDVIDFTVSDLATATVEGLITPIKGDTKTLIAVLVEEGHIDEDKIRALDAAKAHAK